MTIHSGAPKSNLPRERARYVATPESEHVRSRLNEPGPGEAIIVYDLEYTAWEGSLARRWGGEGEYRELVQIGAVKLENAKDYPEIASFERLCLPQFNPILSDYFIGLTGITNDDLERAGQPFGQVIADFAELVGDTGIIAANGNDVGCLIENCGWRGVSMSICEGRTVNLRPLFMAFLDLPVDQTVSSDLPARFGREMEGAAHTGLADARAIALALREARRDGGIV